MIFLTVGSQFPFNRLTMAVDSLVQQGEIPERIFAQIGDSSYKPRNFKAVSSLEKTIYDIYIRESSCIISHAGMGIISLALNNNKPLLVMPRLKKFNEVVNDHQFALAKKFESLGHILVAYGLDDLPIKIKQLPSFTPRPREKNSKLIITRITEFLNTAV